MIGSINFALLQDCVSRIISSIMEGDSISADVPLGGEGDLEGVTRSTALLTASQLNALVCKNVEFKVDVVLMNCPTHIPFYN